jgi:hypothetical protein
LCPGHLRAEDLLCQAMPREDVPSEDVLPEAVLRVDVRAGHVCPRGL